jgi:glutamine cyclotransferase
MRILLLAAFPIGFAYGSATQTSIPEFSYCVVHTYPHDRTAFTEGLFYLNGFLYEGTGLPGKSSIRKVKLETGQVLHKHEIPEAYFGEGIVAWKNRLIELTYTMQIGFIYDLNTFKLQGTFHYNGEGWSMTQDGERIIMDDGTSDIHFWNPEGLEEIGRIRVTASGRPVENLNELEWVKGEIYANIWHTDRIARINAVTGKITGWIDLTGLLPRADLLPGPERSEQVLNGIAYDSKRDRLFVTGKYWPKLFEIRLLRKHSSTNARASCSANALPESEVLLQKAKDQCYRTFS